MILIVSCSPSHQIRCVESEAEKKIKPSLTSSDSPARCCPALSASARTAERCPNASLSCCTEEETKRTKTTSQETQTQDNRHEEGEKRSDLTNLWTFSSRALSFQPALDAGEAEQVSAAQSGKPVFSRRRPGLEADGAGVAFALVGLRRLD